MPHAAMPRPGSPARSRFERNLASRTGPSNVVRELSAFVWTVLELAGAPALRDAGSAVYPFEPDDAAPPEDELRDMLLAAAAALCQFAGPCESDEKVKPPACDVAAADVLQAAHRLIAALEQASRAELDEAQAYFEAPPWSRVLAARQPALTELGIGVARFMIDCAAERAV